MRQRVKGQFFYFQGQAARRWRRGSMCILLSPCQVREGLFFGAWGPWWATTARELPGSWGRRNGKEEQKQGQGFPPSQTPGPAFSFFRPKLKSFSWSSFCKPRCMVLGFLPSLGLKQELAGWEPRLKPAWAQRCLNPGFLPYLPATVYCSGSSGSLTSRMSHCIHWDRMEYMDSLWTGKRLKKNGLITMKRPA